MSLLNEALRKNSSTVRLSAPLDVQVAKTFNLKTPLFIGTVIVIAALIIFWSLSTRRAAIPNKSVAVSATQEQNNSVVTNSSPLTATDTVDDVILQGKSEKDTAILPENQKQSITAKSTPEHVANRRPDGNQTLQEIGLVANENNIKATAASGSSVKTPEAPVKNTPEAKVKVKAAGGKNHSSTNITKEDQDTVADGFYQKALQFHGAGRIEEAINMYREALKHSPDNSGASYNLSSAYIEVSKYSEAYAILNNLFASNPGSPEIKLNLAIAEIGLARPAEAIDLLNSVDTENKKLRFSKFLHLGVAASQAGKLEDALAFYKKAEEINTGYPKLLYNIALTNDKLGNYNDAAAYYKKFLAIGSSSHDETEAIKARISTLQDYISNSGI